MEENQNYPIEELICLVGILVKCDDISRETLTSKAAGIALAMENSLPSQDIGSEMREQVAEAEQRSLAREGIKTEQFKNFDEDRLSTVQRTGAARCRDLIPWPMDRDVSSR